MDVNRMHREGSLRLGSRGHWVWSRGGEEVARIGYKKTETGLVLDYRIRQNGGDWQPITQIVPLTYVDCHYGNQRPYFRCPGMVNGRHCGRRVAKLFLGGGYFLCRHCCNITYTSQSEVDYDRMLRRANKRHIALGGEPRAAYWIASKPKGMWQRTYQRKCLEIEYCERQANQLFLSRFQHETIDCDVGMFFG
jgi:hypothetical protein